MSSLELNKIAAAVLLAGILAMLTGFLASNLVEPTKLAKNVYVVEGVAAPASAEPAAEAPKEIPPIAPLLASASVEAGEAVSKKCAACHSFNKGGAAKVGPNLWSVVNGPHAHAEGFAYSAAIQGMKDKPWTFEELNKFIYNPKAYAPGTKMSFAGLPKAEERAAILVWLRAQADSPAPLPQ